MNSQSFNLFFNRACLIPDSTVLQLSVLLYWICFFKVKSLDTFCKASIFIASSCAS